MLHLNEKSLFKGNSLPGKFRSFKGNSKIYEIKKSQIQNSYIESFSDEWLWVVKNLTRKGTPATKSIAITHVALMRLLEIVSDKITLDEKSRKLQFQGEDTEDLFEKNAYQIESKRYRRKFTQLHESKYIYRSITTLT